MLSLVTVSPVINAFHSFWIYKIKVGFFGLINSIICSLYLVFHSRARTEFVIVFNWNHFDMRLLNLRTNFYLFIVDFYKTKKSNLDRRSGTVAQRIEALSLYGSRWALSEDTAFNSYPSRPEVYLVKNVVRSITTIDIYWQDFSCWRFCESC